MTGGSRDRAGAQEAGESRPSTAIDRTEGACPIACEVTQWIDTQAYCGDNARLECTLTGNPEDGPATVEILHPTNGSVVETIDSFMICGHIAETWVAKAQTANWRTDLIRFQVRAAGQTCMSSNEFTFRQRPTTNWILKNVPHPSGGGFAPVSEHHDARLETGRVHYSLKLRTDGDPFDDAKKLAAKTLIQNVWNNGFSAKKFHRTRCQRGDGCDCTYDCCKAGFRLDVNFVSNGEHALIHIHAWNEIDPYPPCSQGQNEGDWTDPPRPADLTPYAHEVGHLLGQYDEYTDGAYDPATPPIQPRNDPGNLMSDLSQVLLNRHYRYALAFLNANTDRDTYGIVPP